MLIAKNHGLPVFNVIEHFARMRIGEVECAFLVVLKDSLMVI